MLWGRQGEMRLHLCPEQPPFGHAPIENGTLVPESDPFRARPQRAPSACTSGMKPHSYTYQNYANASTHYVIPNAAKNLHGTAFTFVMKLQQVPCHFGGDRLCFCPETALGSSTLKETACAFVTKSLQVTRLWRGLRALSGQNYIRSPVVGNSQVRGRPLGRAARSA